MVKYPCIKCNDNVAGKGKEGKGMQCSFCELYCHQHCAGISDELYKHLREQDAAGFHFWICSSCKSSSMVFKKQLDQLSQRLNKVEAETSQNSKDMLEVRADIVSVNKEVEKIAAATTDSSESTQNAVFTELSERESKKCNLVFHRLAEPDVDLSGTDKKAADIASIIKISEILSCCVTKEDVKFCTRIGEVNRNDAIPRPLLFGLRKEDKQKKILEQAFKLSKTDYQHISIVPDLTKKQRNQDSDVRKEAEKRNSELPEEESLNWKWRTTGPRGNQYLVKVRLPRQQQGQHQQQQQPPRLTGGNRERRGSKRGRSPTQEETSVEDQPPKKH